MRRIRTAVVDVDSGLPDLDLASADEWRIVVMHGTVPRAYATFASPGDAGPATLELLLRRPAERAREEERYRRELLARFGGGIPAEPPPLKVSVVVPTHRRPEVLVGLLASVTDLDPAPDEVIVVDNDPGDYDIRPLVDAVDFRYVREERRGLNIARRTGLLASTGDVVVFTDDDCIVSAGWLAGLPELFADPLVGVVAGPGFAWELDTGTQLRREEEAGFTRGLGARRFDWRTLAPPRAGAVGSGNSMAVRREPAVALEIFPPELDAGTRAPAAGDLFAIFRLLSAGFDAVYDPRMLFWHRHPPSGLRATIRAYGHGAGAYYTKLLAEERELAVIPVWWWFVRRWFEALLDAQSGVADRGRLRVRWCYLKASLFGPLAWRRALADLGPTERAVLVASRAAADAPPPVAGSAPATPPPDLADRSAVSVIVADHGEGAPALALGPDDELIIRAAAGDPSAAWHSGAAAATRDVLLFLDSCARPAAGLIAAHAGRHSKDAALVVAGHTVLQPADRRLATLAAWRDRVRVERAPVVASNVSVRRELYERGLGDVDLVHEPAAIAVELVASTNAEYARRPSRAPLLDVLERLKLRGAWAKLADAGRLDGRQPRAKVEAARRRVSRTEWRATAHAAAGQPGRSTPATDVSALVVLGPAHGEGERAAARTAALPLIEADAAAGRVGHWRAIAEAVAATDADVVALPMRGARVNAAWLAEVKAALEGTRVAVVVGAGLAPEDPPSGLGLFARDRSRARWSGAGSPPQFMALRRDLYERVGGIDPAGAQLGWSAPVLDYLQRALEAGLTVGRIDTHGVEPAGCHRPARSVGEWHRTWARGALHARRARSLGGLRGVHAFVFEGALPLARFRRPDRAGRQSARHAAGSLLAFLLGAASALRRPQHRDLPPV